MRQSGEECEEKNAQHMEQYMKSLGDGESTVAHSRWRAVRLEMGCAGEELSVRLGER